MVFLTKKEEDQIGSDIDFQNKHNEIIKSIQQLSLSRESKTGIELFHKQINAEISLEKCIRHNPGVDSREDVVTDMRILYYKIFNKKTLMNSCKIVAELAVTKLVRGNGEVNHFGHSIPFLVFDSGNKTFNELDDNEFSFRVATLALPNIKFKDKDKYLKFKKIIEEHREYLVNTFSLD